MQSIKSDKEIYLEILRMAREVNPHATTEDLIREAKKIEAYIFTGIKPIRQESLSDPRIKA